jgi:hypothetical protein
MKCEWYQRWVMRCADDELAGWRLAWLRHHLGRCERCAGQLAQLRRMRELIAGQKERYAATMDDALFWQRLRANLQPAPPAPLAPDMVMAFSQRQAAPADRAKTNEAEPAKARKDKSA